MLNRMDRGMQTGSAMSLIIWVGQPSGSGDLPDFKFVILLRTKTGVNWKVWIGGSWSSDCSVGMELVSLWVKTLEK